MTDAAAAADDDLDAADREALAALCVMLAGDLVAGRRQARRGQSWRSVAVFAAFRVQPARWR